MNCLVTAGPAYESLDEVRRLTNFSTGKLGTQLACYLAGRGHTVILLRGNSSIFPNAFIAGECIEFSTASDLESRFESLASGRIDAVFHAAAVSDFRCGKVCSRLPGGELKELRQGKISSQDAPLFAELLPVPKLIGKLRAWFHAAWLAGWKYEVDGDQASAIDRARNQIRECATDACVVNGPAYGPGFGFLTQANELLHLADAPALFECLEGRLPR
jgi:phosphopantothenoylcysteine decarboxylase/phosphopantothenate--cysteine ligase